MLLVVVTDGHLLRHSGVVHACVLMGLWAFGSGAGNSRLEILRLDSRFSTQLSLSSRSRITSPGQECFRKENYESIRLPKSYRPVLLAVNGPS